MTDTRRPAAARRLGRLAMVLVPLGFAAVFFVYPVVTILARGLAPGGRLDLTAFTDVLGDAGLRGVAWFTLWQAVVSTLLTLLVALPGAYVVARYDFPGRRLVRALATVPFVLPTVVVGSAFLALLGPGGPLAGLGLDRSVGAILVAHVFFEYAIVLRLVGGFWANLDPDREDAARVLGASRWRTFREVTLPLLSPAIAAAASIVFLFTFTSFGVVLLLGGPQHTTLEVEIYRQTAVFLDLPTAAVLAILQLAAVTGLLVVLGRVQRARALRQRLVATRDTARRPRGPGARLLVAVNLLVMALLLGTPLAVLVHRSVDTAGGLGLDFYRALSERSRGGSLLVPPLEAVRNSLAFAGVATVLALLVGGLASVVVARRGTRAAFALDTLLMLPLGVSAVTVGFGFLLALDDPPLDLRTEPVLVPIAHALVAIPFVMRAVVPALRSVDERLREVAGTLGASPARVWREVDLPLVGRAFLVAAGFAFAVSLGEFGATVFIARPDYPTVPVAIFRSLGRPGDVSFGQAMALSTILMTLTAAAILAVDRLRVRDVGEF